eukprot:352204-Amorphochlora_amoeboformis.AAC.1
MAEVGYFRTEGSDSGAVSLQTDTLETKIRDPVTYEHINKYAPVKDVNFVVFEHGGKQFKVVEDDLLMLDYMKDVEVGSELVFDKVMLVGSADHTVIGKPMVPDAKVRAVVEEQTQTQKIRVFKKRRRKASSKRTVGHRSWVTLLRVLEVDIGATAKEAIRQ